MSGTARMFNEAFPDRPVSASHVKSVVSNCVTTFNIKDDPRSGSPSITSQDLQINVLEIFAAEPNQSLRAVAAEVDVDKSTKQFEFYQEMLHVIETQPDYSYWRAQWIVIIVSK